MAQSTEHVTRSVRLMLGHGLWKELLMQSWQKAFSVHVYVDAVLDTGAFTPPRRHAVHLSLRPVRAPEESGLDAVLADRTLPSQERHEASRRLCMLATGIRTCYAIADDAGAVRAVQWLITADENAAVRRVYGDWYPWLAPDEGLMEHVYIFPRYRGTGLLPSALGTVVEAARARGITRILTSIPGDNTNSLMSFTGLGFKPVRIRLERRRFGMARRTVFPVSSCTDVRSFARFVALPANLAGREAGPIAF